ncbi:hypothetical protein [Streptosporangium sp. NPDC000396]|uniref:WXG100 family type VII secretion target n=1 Tax=Streptosporangium sp. NPDC000396 TaxID=3366185 RepID=UPI0036816804
MGAQEMPIRQKIDTSEFDGVTLDILKSALDKANPELIQNAAGEFRSAMGKLNTLIEKLDKHLDSLDKNWTAGEDAKTVKTQLRRLRESTQSVVDSIVEPNPPGKMGPPVPKGVAPALEMYSTTLKAFRGDHIPEKSDSDVSFLEGAYQGGMAGAGGGAVVGSFFAGVGAVPGAVIGAVGGTIVGGVTSLFTDGPFMNMFGDSKEEQDMKAAKEHLKKLTDATAQVNDAFPNSLKTDIPEFTPPKISPVNLPAPPGSTIPGGYPPGQGFDPFAPGGNVPDWNDPSRNGPGWNDPGKNGPGGDIPGGNIPGWNDPSRNGPGWNDPGKNGPGGDIPGGNIPGWNDPSQNGPGANGGHPGGSGANGQGGNGTQPPGTSGLDTKLAGYDSHMRDLAGRANQLGDLNQQNLLGNSGHQGSSGSGSGNGSGSSTTGIGTSTPGSGAFGSGGAADSRGMNGARALNASTGATPSVFPHGKNGSKENEEAEEHERTTWMWEDEDLFMSDKSTTTHLIDGTPKRKGRA